MKKRTFLAAMAAAPLAPLLSACGGGNDSGSASIRLVNASTGYDALDLYVNTGLVFSNVAYNTASDYNGVGSDSYTIALRAAGGSTTLESTVRSFSDGVSYSIVAFGERGDLTSVPIAESEPAPDSGFAKLRVVNRSDDAIGIYIADAGGDPVDAVSFADSVNSGGSSAFTSEGAGDYTVYITTVGSTLAERQVLLKIPTLTLTDQQVANLVVMPSTGAVLVNAILLVQNGAATPFINDQARVRLVAGVTGNRVVTAKVGTTTVSSGATATNVGSYVNVPQGTATVTVTVDGDTLDTVKLSTEAGADYTIVVYGDTAPKVKILTDDNSLPSDNAQTNFRLVHLAPDLASDALSLFLNNSKQLASDIAYGAASDYLMAAAVTDTTNSFVVKVGQSGATVYSQADTAIDENAVYTLFVFGENSGFLSEDRSA